MTIPADLKYTEAHVWVRQETDGTFTAGITDHAQAELGDVVFVQPPQPGAAVKRGEACGVIESVKTMADLYAPLTGEVVAVNEALPDTPEKLNEDPYSAWIFRIRPTDPSELAGLLDSAAYQKVAGTP